MKHINRIWGFIHIPKTAGTSMEKALGIEKTLHLKAKDVFQTYPNAFLWAFMRDPIQRVESMYWWEKMNNNHRDLSMSEWVEKVFVLENPHYYYSQSEYVTHEGKVIVDFIGRYEHLHIDWPKISNKPLPYERRSLRDKQRINQKAQRILENHHPEDFELYEKVLNEQYC